MALKKELKLQSGLIQEFHLTVLILERHMELSCWFLVAQITSRLYLAQLDMPQNC